MGGWRGGAAALGGGGSGGGLQPHASCSNTTFFPWSSLLLLLFTPTTAPLPPRRSPAAATAGVPLLAGTLPGLFLSRAAVGLGEGVAPSAATDVVARVIPTDQRSRAISFIFGGLHVGRCVSWGGRRRVCRMWQGCG